MASHKNIILIKDIIFNAFSLKTILLKSINFICTTVPLVMKYKYEETIIYSIGSFFIAWNLYKQKSTFIKVNDN